VRPGGHRCEVRGGFVIRFLQHIVWATAALSLAATTGLHAETAGLTDEEVVRLKTEALALVNADRAASGLAPVELDDRASKLGDLYCELALAMGLRGHYLTDGLSPFQRYAFWAGGTDYTGQNVCSTYGVNTATWSYESVRRRMVEYEAMMMAERPPNDWHRKNILNPWHTHVGIGLACGPTGIRMTQEFVNRHVVIHEMDTEQPLHGTPQFAGKLLDPENVELAGITVFYEPPPRELSVEQANTRNSYGLPDEHRFLRPKLPRGSFYTDTRRRGDIVMDDDGTFACQLRFWKGEPGIYGVMVRLRPKGSRKTDDQFPATYVCLNVFDRPEAGPEGEERPELPAPPHGARRGH